MTKRISLILCTLASLGVAGSVQAQKPGFIVVERAVEVLAARVTLPSSPESSLVMPGCADCPPKPYATTLATRYFLGEQEVSLNELTAAVRPRPDAILTVQYAVKTREITRVSALILPRVTR